MIIMIPKIIEEWKITDRWWTETPFVKNFAEVDWEYCKVVMVKQDGDSVWRIHKTH